MADNARMLVRVEGPRGVWTTTIGPGEIVKHAADEEVRRIAYLPEPTGSEGAAREVPPLRSRAESAGRVERALLDATSAELAAAIRPCCEETGTVEHANHVLARLFAGGTSYPTINAHKGEPGSHPPEVTGVATSPGLCHEGTCSTCDTVRELVRAETRADGLRRMGVVADAEAPRLISGFSRQEIYVHLDDDADGKLRAGDEVWVRR